MDPTAALGIEVMTRTPRALRVAALAALFWIAPGAPVVSAADRYAVVITGASAGQVYAEKYDRWRNVLAATLRQRFGYPDDHVFVLADTSGPAATKATKQNIQSVFGALRSRLAADDILFVMLIGHGTVADEEDAKFNLVGPDLPASQWAALLKMMPGRLVFVDATAGSFPFLRRLSAPGRVVVTATDSVAQQFETVFGEFFVKALDDPTADLDKSGRVSIWEAFSYASAAVRQWYDQHGQLPTERPLLDDNGDGIGREAQSPGSDGALARTIYLAPELTRGGDSELAKRRTDLERQLDDLRVRKASSNNPAQFDAEIERILLEIAALSRRIRRP
jgi:hypothetical protein